MAFDPAKVDFYTVNFTLPVYRYGELLWHDNIAELATRVDAQLQSLTVAIADANQNAADLVAAERTATNNQVSNLQQQIHDLGVDIDDANQYALDLFTAERNTTNSQVAALQSQIADERTTTDNQVDGLQQQITDLDSGLSQQFANLQASVNQQLAEQDAQIHASENEITARLADMSGQVARSNRFFVLEHAFS